METIGQALKNARKQRNYSLKDIHDITNIQMYYLQAIEDNRLNDLPEGVYRRSFIRQYAEVVGVSLESLPSSDQFSEMAAGQRTDTVAADKEFLDRKKRRYNHKYSLIDRFYNAFPSVLMVLLVFLLIVAMYFAWRKSSDGRHKDDGFTQPAQVTESHTDKKESARDDKHSSQTDDATRKKEDISVKLLSSEGTETVYQLKAKGVENLELVLEAKSDRTWIVFVVDGQVYVSQMLEKGETYTASVPSTASEFLLTVGNAPATSLSINRTPIQYSRAAEDIALQNIKFQIEH